MSRKNGAKVLASANSSAQYSQETRPSYSGFQSFLKWFKKNERDRLHQNTSNLNRSIPNGHRIYHSSDTISPSSSPALSASSSCDSIYSTATTGFAFIPPNQYRPYGNACQPEKLIAVGPVTDTYRDRLRAHQNAKEIDKKLELTLRKKYNIFDTDTLTSNDTLTNRNRTEPNRYYTDLSLPQPTVSSPSPSEEAVSGSGFSYAKRRRSHRRTVSDSSKDKKAGAYVHVKGKRKAPKPPPEQVRKENGYNGTLSPVSTLGRKKRRAPPPPIQQTQSVNEEIPIILTDGLFDDAEIQAIIGGASNGFGSRLTKITTNMDKSVSPVRSVTSPIRMDDPMVQCTDTLKLERGMLKSNRENTMSPPPLQNKDDEKPVPTSVSPISPRPWYKRSSGSNKDYSIPFKREITLKTMEKRKTKNSQKELDSPQLPEVSFCRNSSLFDGFFSRVSSHHDKLDDHEKRRSGIGMPNISELDREAAEIVSKEQATEKAKLQAETEKYFSSPTTDDASSSEPNQRASTKDLISRFEESNQVKFTVNSAFIDKADRYFDNKPVQQTQTQTTTENESVKNKLVAQTSASSLSSSSQSSSSSASMTQSIFSNMRQNQTASDNCSSDSKENSFTNNALLALKQNENKENHLKPDGIVLSGKKTTTWICSYCTLENYNWRVICEVCERIKPYDKESAMASKVIAANQGEQSKFRYAKNVEPNKSADKFTKEERLDLETKTEKMMKYFRPKSSVNNTLSKSASETSVGNPFMKKSTTSVSKLIGSPKLTLKQKQSDIIRPQVTQPGNKRENVLLGDRKEIDRKPELIESSAVITTMTPVYIAPLPAKHDEIVKSTIADVPNIEEIRAVRIAKFADAVKEDKGANNTSEHKPINALSIDAKSDKPLLSDPSSLEREKQRLREMIRAMNARALAEKYPVIQKSTSLDETETQPKTITATSSRPQSTDASKLGAIKKLFHRKTEPEDKVIADNANYSTSKVEKDKEQYTKVSTSVQTTNKPLQKPDVLMLPTPILELNENDASPVSPISKTVPEPSVDKQIDYIYANLKNDMKKNTSNLEEISHQLNTAKGLEDFKATLKTSSKSLTNTNTLALNKILKNLEVAICDGQHELAAKLAMDLAKMKVSLSVTKQQQLQQPKEPIPLQTVGSSEGKTVMVDMFVEDKDTHKGPIHLQLLPSISVLELKEKISKDFNIPPDIQRWILNNSLVTDDKQILSEFNITDKSVIYLYIISPENRSQAPNLPSRNDVKPSNIIAVPVPSVSASTKSFSIENKLNIVENDDNRGAKALPLLMENPFGTLKIGWTCPLCTLINSPNRLGCVACSETRPSTYVVPPEYKVHEDEFDIPEELKNFLADDVDESNKLPCLQLRNDLNKTNVNRKSTEIFNIVVKDESPKPVAEKTANKNVVEMKPNSSVDQTKPLLQTSIVMTAITASPNITKNKYRGVDNYNPHIQNKPEPSGIPYKSPLVKPIRASKLVQATVAKNNLTKTNVASEKSLLKPAVKTIAQTAVTQPPENTNSKHYSELLSLDSSSVVANIEPFECPVCFMKYEAGQGIVLRDCIHTFCRECIINTVKYSDEASVKCPYMDADYSCDSVIQEREIRSLMTKEAYDQHLAISLELAKHRTENAFYCKTPSCRGWCIYEDNVNQFKCPICKITNCLTCRVIHDGLNCKQYQDRVNSDCDSNIEARRTSEMLDEMIVKGEAMKCPICQIILMKKWGCDWLKCSMCKTEVCWVTRGVRWGPEGKGDTSGGCKCGVNGVKCHPKCNYCH